MVHAINIRIFYNNFSRFLSRWCSLTASRLRPFMIKNISSTPRAISTSQISEVFSAFSRWWHKVLHARKKMASERISQRAQLCLRKAVVSHLKMWDFPWSLWFSFSVKPSRELVLSLLWLLWINWVRKAHYMFFQYKVNSGFSLDHDVWLKRWLYKLCVWINKIAILVPCWWLGLTDLFPLKKVFDWLGW